MPYQGWHDFFIFVAGFLLVAVIAINPTSAQQRSDVAEPDPAAADFYNVPDGDKGELAAFVKKLIETRTSPDGSLSQAEHLKKSSEAMVLASERILTGKYTDEQAKIAVMSKILGLKLLDQLGDATASKQITQFIDAMKRHRRHAIRDAAEQFGIQLRFMGWRGFSEAEKRAFANDLIAYIKRSKMNRELFDFVRTSGQAIEFSGDNRLASEIYSEIIPKLSKSNDPQMVPLGERYKGVVRRLNLSGGPIEVYGTLLDGSALDWDAYRGKVVLVDFWASWCGPCIQEMPLIKRYYEAYHDKGFEVIGIGGLNEDKATVISFVEKLQLPWQIVYDEAKGTRRAMAEYYTVDGIPFAVLVDQTGKVVSVLARGRELGRLLHELLDDSSVPADTGPIRK